MTTSDLTYRNTRRGPSDSVERKREYNIQRMWVGGEYISLRDPRHLPGRYESWEEVDIARALPVFHDRHKPATPPTPTIAEVQTDWRDAQIDKTIALASGRYREADESYERVQCGYVYQMRQRDVFTLSKVGFSGDPESRLKAPNTFLEVHREFIIVKAWPAKDKAKAERFVHRFLADKRVSSKELFRGHYEKIRDLIEVAMMEYYDAES